MSRARLVGRDRCQTASAAVERGGDAADGRREQVGQVARLRKPQLLMPARLLPVDRAGMVAFADGAGFRPALLSRALLRVIDGGRS
jgi:hypothetical protein